MLDALTGGVPPQSGDRVLVRSPGSAGHDIYVRPSSHVRPASRASDVVTDPQHSCANRKGEGKGADHWNDRCSRARRSAETTGSHDLRTVLPVETFVIRMWLPDRPGALGQVASRIGAVRGDVVGIDILERDGGQAVDELVVELPDDSLLDILVREIRQVDGVGVEEVRPLTDGRHHDPRLDAFEAV